MSATTNPNLVLLEELAHQMGGAPVEVAVARLPARAKPVTDWQGRPCIDHATAAKMLTAYQEEAAAAEARQRGYQSYLASHAQTRQAAGQLAFEQARRKALEADRADTQRNFAGFVGELSDSPHARQAAREARHEALIAFDARHPITPFERWKEG